MKTYCWEFTPVFKKFKIEFMFLGWGEIQLGFHISFKMLNIEFHIPFGFIRIGYESKYHHIKYIIK